MAGHLFDDRRFMNDQNRKNKVDKVYSDVEELSKDSDLPDRYNNIFLIITGLK